MTRYHMTPDEAGATAMPSSNGWAHYLETVEDLPVSSRVAPGEIRSRLPRRIRLRIQKPSKPCWPTSTGAHARRRHPLAVAGLLRVLPGDASGPSIGELLSAGLGVQGMLWSTSPASTEFETLCSTGWSSWPACRPLSTTAGAAGAG